MTKLVVRHIAVIWAPGAATLRGGINNNINRIGRDIPNQTSFSL